jgi:uncharacterized membrane protein
MSTRSLTIALVASVALNLFCVGFLVAGVTRRGRHDPGPRAHHGPFLGPRGLHDVDPGAEHAMRRAMGHKREAFEAHGRTLREARRKVGAAFSAEPFDPKALQAAFSELRAQTAESQRVLHESLVEVAPTLDPEQRRKLGRHALARERGPGRRGF